MQDNIKLNIGILVIATNKYTVFVDPLVKSINKYFLPNHNKTVFLFSDKMEENYEEKNIIKIYQEHMQWPMPTLKRYEIFFKNKESYNNIDILYYLDADMLINDFVNDNFLPTDNRPLVAVVHPGNLRTNMSSSYERNPNSTAFISDTDLYNVYHCGGVQGGKTLEYLNVCETLMNNINEDFKKNIIAVWHDESHWNSFLIKNKSLYKELPASYCYPESWDLSIPKIILALDKDHKKMRE